MKQRSPYGEVYDGDPGEARDFDDLDWGQVEQDEVYRCETETIVTREGDVSWRERCTRQSHRTATTVKVLLGVAAMYVAGKYVVLPAVKSALQPSPSPRLNRLDDKRPVSSISLRGN